MSLADFARLPLVGGELLAGEQRGASTTLLPAHRLDESPAGYSSASCSPAELASASPAIRNDARASMLRKEICSERQVSEFLRVSLKGTTPSAVSS